MNVQHVRMMKTEIRPSFGRIHPHISLLHNKQGEHHIRGSILRLLPDFTGCV